MKSFVVVITSFKFYLNDPELIPSLSNGVPLGVTIGMYMQSVPSARKQGAGLLKLPIGELVPNVGKCTTQVNRCKARENHVLS